MALHTAHRHIALLAAILVTSITPTILRAQPEGGHATNDPTASEVTQTTSIGGYGEITYVEPEGSPRGTVDVPRFVIFMEHEFSDDLGFVSELEVEHVKLEGGVGGEVALEQAYLQYHLSDRFNIRAGLVLLPIGIINEFHEPPSYNGVLRPTFDQYIIPTTWREIGVGIVGKVPEVEGLQYRAYLTSGMNAAGFEGPIGIYEGRPEGAEVPMQSLALSARVEYLTGGLRTGVFVYHGGSAFGNAAIAEGLFGAPVTLYGLDAQFTTGNLHLRGIVAMGSIGEAKKINDAYHAHFDSASGGVEYENPVGSGFGGGYIEAAYDVAQHLSSGTSQQLLPFVRFEKFNTQSEMPAGIEADPANDRTNIVVGITFKPTYNTAFKLDWTMADDATSNKLPGQFALGVGYNF